MIWRDRAPGAVRFSLLWEPRPRWGSLNRFHVRALGHASLSAAAKQQSRQPDDVGCNPPRLVARHQCRRRAPTGLILEIDVGERLKFPPSYRFVNQT